MGKRKNIKWYTYVDREFDSEMKKFMKNNHYSNQAQIIRSSVKVFMEIVRNMQEKHSFNNPNLEQVKDFLHRALLFLKFERDNVLSILKQRLSPLKTSLLVLENQEDLPPDTSQVIQHSKKAIKELETFLFSFFEPNSSIRLFETFDILYVEDNELERETMKMFLSNFGKTIKCVETSDEALQIMKKKTPKCLIIDIDLPTSSIQGDILCKTIKRDSDTANIPVILITATISETKKRALIEKTCADAVILKPLENLNDIRNIVSRFLN